MQLLASSVSLEDLPISHLMLLAFPPTVDFVFLPPENGNMVGRFTDVTQAAEVC